MTVKLPQLLAPERVQYSDKLESQKTAFDSLTELLAKGQSEVTTNEIFDALVSREKLGSTCIGNGIAIPRAKINITNPRAALLVLKKGLAINSVDKKPVNFLLAILIPKKNNQSYSGMLTNINSQLTSKETLEKLIIIKNPKRLADYFQEILEDNE